MNKGVYIGENFASMPHKILILGESHHDKNYALGCDYPRETKETVHNYLRAKKREIKWENCWNFFTKIAHVFDTALSGDKLIEFWNKVSFGNYIGVNCDVKSAFASRYIEKEDNRKVLNDALFGFVNEKGIDTVVCMSKLVYNNLPVRTEHEKENTVNISEKNNLIFTEYSSNISHQFTSVTLTKNLRIIMLPHPSSYGFKPEDYNEYLKELIY